MRRRTAAMSAVFAVALAVLAGCQGESPSEQPSTESVEPVEITTAPTSAASSTIASASPSTKAPTTTLPPADPAAELAESITAAERAIRDVSLPDSVTAMWGREQQRAYRRLAGMPELDDAVRALLAPDVVAPFDANVAARRAVASFATTRPAVEPAATLPAWTIVEPRPVGELLAYYREAEAATGVPWYYLAAINLVETRMGRISGASSAGAVGPMQFLPETWAMCCTGDVTDPHDAIVGAATYLVARGAPADMAAALYGYNPNAGYVGAVQAYAMNIAADERAYYGYHAWEVYVGSTAGSVRLAVGYSEAVPVDAATYVAEHPESLEAG